MSKEKKKFRDTKVGKFLNEKVPHVLDVVGDVLPDKGVFGIVKNIIDKDSSIPDEDKLEFHKLCQEHEKEMFTLEVQDRNSARTRETDFAKALGHVDWMMYFVCLTGLLSFAFVLYTLVYLTIPESNRDLFIHAIGMVEGVAVSIFGYYFGSSKGSADKTKILKG